MTPYEMATALRKIADQLTTISADTMCRTCGCQSTSSPTGPDRGDEYVTHVVDALGEALFGHVGEHRDMSSGRVHYQARGTVDGVHVCAYGAVQR